METNKLELELELELEKMTLFRTKYLFSGS